MLSSPAVTSVPSKSRLSAIAKAANLISRLDDVQSASSNTIELIRLGAVSVPLLGNALLYGRRRSIPQPRCCLVDALATLGANDILLKYLTDTTPVKDPAIRFAEDAVVNLAARAIKLSFSAEAYCALFDLAQTRSLPGVLEALALYRRTESIPCFIRALESDLSRAAAIRGLEFFGQRATPYLFSEIFKPQPTPPEKEATSSLHRRRSCIELLEHLRLSPGEYEPLLDLLFEQDGEMVLGVCTIILNSGNEQQCAAAVRRLRAMRPHVNWLLRDELDELVGRFEEARITS